MKTLSILTAALALTATPNLFAQTTTHWSGVATVHGQSVPVRLDLTTAKDGTVSGSFLNGNEVATSTGGIETQAATGTHLVLRFDHFARKLEGDLTPTTFTGSFGGAKGPTAPIELHPTTAATPASAPSQPAAIAGDWEIAVKSPKGESAWNLNVTPVGTGELKAVILRIDGDTGGLYGSPTPINGEYRVSHFNPAGGALYSLKPQPDGTLLVSNLLRDDQQWAARRPAEARKENLPPPTKDTDQTTVTDPTQPLHFSAPALASGTTVSSDDARFKGKVVLVAVGGSWCPNCHDEAPFLVDLYNRYHADGLEIVNISFEEQDQLKDPERLRAFVAKYHITYPVLLGGTPDQLHDVLPQGKNLNCWPTAFFVGRDGLVKEVHAGFAGPATGTAHNELVTETNQLIQKLLAQKDIASR